MSEQLLGVVIGAGIFLAGYVMGLWRASIR